MKLAFYKQKELNELLNEMINTSMESELTCRVSYSEEIQSDAVNIFVDGQFKETIDLWDILSQISKYLNVNITHYDVIEVGDAGEGFAFFF
ncbi:hypothetical protein NDS46_31815 (plasmid) [Paenibacillus thiaminolyticus]|uniref:hypothetical protein n=1 Tax=Paenibacillus thiaminolyticus TaxID=49283 RepID=UPI00232A8598|nr:hypothetical protein [Paenibacillus thiaminolyticus]WCF11546.1 hypothetical protein NDS46_31815 [Paenibacillus thiaminolyticus]